MAYKELFKWEDNPLKDVKVIQPAEVEFDSQRIVFRVLNGSDKNYRKYVKQQVNVAFKGNHAMLGNQINGKYF